MSGYILRGRQENITLPAAAVESLLRRGEGDAALLYLALQRFGRGVTPEELEKVPNRRRKSPFTPQRTSPPC